MFASILRYLGGAPEHQPRWRLLVRASIPPFRLWSSTKPLKGSKNVRIDTMPSLPNLVHRFCKSFENLVGGCLYGHGARHQKTISDGLPDAHRRHWKENGTHSCLSHHIRYLHTTTYPFSVALRVTTATYKIIGEWMESYFHRHVASQELFVFLSPLCRS